MVFADIAMFGLRSKELPRQVYFGTASEMSAYQLLVGIIAVGGNTVRASLAKNPKRSLLRAFVAAMRSNTAWFPP